MAVLFSIKDLTRRFGSFTAVDHVSLDIDEAGILSIIGPNGAGKTTFFNLVTGYLRPDEGQVTFRGRPITGLPPNKIIEFGISRSFQITSLFPEMTLLDNVCVGFQSHMGDKWRLFRDYRKNVEVRDKAEALLARVHLLEKKDQVVTAISHGDRKILDLALALTIEPDVLLLDEPMSGLAKEERARIVSLITNDFATRMKVIIVEHDMDVVFGISDFILVLAQGKILASGTPNDIAGNEQVQEVYLGRKHRHAEG